MIFSSNLVKLDLDPHSENLPDPDPHKLNADPQPCLRRGMLLQIPTFFCRTRS